jgi:hypothetical protein
VDPEAQNIARNTLPQALRLEARGLILIALAVLVLDRIGCFHRLHRSTP